MLHCSVAILAGEGDGVPESRAKTGGFGSARNHTRELSTWCGLGYGRLLANACKRVRSRVFP